MVVAQVLSFFLEKAPVALKEMTTEQVRQVIRVAIGIALYCQKYA